MNLGEILYATKWRFGDERKIEILAHIHRLHFTILPVPNELIYQAAEYKAAYRISYADCFLLACAANYNATIVTGDPEFRNVRHLARIHWI
jgi:ribonuclease VapC